MLAERLILGNICYKLMKAYTIQTVAFYEELMRDGIAFCKREGYWCRENRFQYDWMVEQMRKRIGEPPIPEIKYPVWVWLQYNSRKDPIPPMSPKDILPGKNEAVMLELEVPDNAVLLSDLDLWIHPLNGWEICGKTESKLFDKEKAAYEKEHGKCYHLNEWSPTIQSKIIATWERVFDLDWVDAYQAPSMRWNRSIQGTIWLLRKEWLRVAHIFNRHSEIKRINYI